MNIVIVSTYYVSGEHGYANEIRHEATSFKSILLICQNWLEKDVTQLNGKQNGTKMG